MSLQVWLPLNGDLENRGLSNSSITNNLTIDNSGKLGKCAKTSSSATTSLDYTPNFNTTSISFGGWFKFNKAEIAAKVEGLTYSSSATYPTGNLIGNDSYGGIGLIWNGNKIYNSSTFSSMSVFSTLRTATVNNSTSSINIEFDKWVHIYLTYNANTRVLSLYKDGNLVNSITFSEFTNGISRSLSLNYNATYGGNGPSANIPFYTSDIRIYDHCLSDKEVKEISKGLVLHYKLDSDTIQQLNNCYLYPTMETSSSSAGWSHWNQTGGSGSNGQNTDRQYIYRNSNTYSHWVANANGATGSYLFYQSPAFDGGYRSLTAIIKEEHSLPITESICFPVWNARDGGVPNNKWTSIVALGNGFYLCKCEGIHQDGSNNLVGIYVTVGNKVYISECYLENYRECASDIFGNFSGKVNDSSGYGYNGTINGTLTINNDSAKYSKCTVFDGNTASITLGNLSTICPEGNFTFNCWIYKDGTWSTKSWETILGGPSGFELETKYSGINSPVIVNYSWGKTSMPYNLNEWTMITMTRNSSETKYYINGSLAGTGTAGTIPSGNYFIGAWSSSSGQNYKGKVSDVRIYNTVLSESDIKELYETSASIDKNGNLYCRELVEV